LQHERHFKNKKKIKILKSEQTIQSKKTSEPSDLEFVLSKNLQIFQEIF
jgi:hypothetical protein